MNAALDDLRARLPDHARDLRLNLESVLSEGGAPGLSQSRIAMVALASAIAARHAPLVAALSTWAAAHADERDVRGARAAAAIMAMTNIYYRFVYLVGDEEYGKMRAALRMNVLAKPDCDAVGFELAALAVSTINGCASCVAAHEKTLRKHDVSAQGVQSAARIAAVVHAVAVTLEQDAATADLAAAA